MWYPKRKNSHIEISNDMRMNIDTVGYNRTRGLYAYNAPNLSKGDDLKVGDNLSIRVSASGNGKSSGPDVRGLFNGNSGVSIGSHAGVTVEGSSDAVKTIGLYTAGNGTTDIGDDASIMVNSDAVKNNHVLHTESGGAITLRALPISGAIGKLPGQRAKEASFLLPALERRQYWEIW